MSDNLTELSQQLHDASEKKQLTAIAALAAMGEEGQGVLLDYLAKNTPLEKPLLVVGTTYQTLRNLGQEAITAQLQQNYPTGIFPLQSAQGVDYLSLQEALARQDFESADEITRDKLCELAGPGASQRQWLYFTEVEKFPALDLHTINALWWLHSNGNFGFSVQRRLWLASGKEFTKLWPKIGWKSGNVWTRWPKGFTWDLSAPQGHLPLLNQLRGVRVAEFLYSHPVWSQYGW
ncbi:GUN4 N-terminal ARM-like repeat domain-containing protein [Synechocystis sp. FACHB-383]|uniref:GUN4 domain-containing protein n=1 Tax=Synechocystis sp. FACHB-383 TaxID=2692864 RepID=UPI0016849BC1|nr:GUN4 domain-containing protein [Synechocystis sp. FACHB-383]MBD2653957.1 GUN4 N-terminal ARM-like repeat domain-containing protein [Synechocystis sp. FACHB-383]